MFQRIFQSKESFNWFLISILLYYKIINITITIINYKTVVKLLIVILHIMYVSYKSESVSVYWKQDRAVNYIFVEIIKIQ